MAYSSTRSLYKKILQNIVSRYNACFKSDDLQRSGLSALAYVVGIPYVGPNLIDNCSERNNRIQKQLIGKNKFDQVNNMFEFKYC